MTTIEISLTSDYCPSWSVWAGLREIIANGIDGEREFGYKLGVSHSGNVLTVVNEGGRIPREALLIGFSSKRGNHDLAGQFGEGLKLGVLALIRAGLEITIYNRRGIWRPAVGASEAFDAEVLKFHISQVDKDCGGLRVEVKGVSEEDWLATRKNFLFLEPAKNVFKTSRGTVLLDPSLAGCIFARGIFVDRDPKFKFGYDLPDADIDRDRRMVNRSDLLWTTAAILEEAATKNHGMFMSVYGLMEMGAEDVENIGYTVSRETAERATEIFREIYGEQAVPVRTISESREVEHLGRDGIVVPQPMAKVMEKIHGSYNEMRRRLADSAFSLCSAKDLSENQRKNLDTAIELVGSVDPEISLQYIDVVVFADHAMQGLYQDSRIRLSLRVLDDLVTALRVLAHEWAHLASQREDGQKRFVDGVELLLSRVAIAQLELRSVPRITGSRSST